MTYILLVSFFFIYDGQHIIIYISLVSFFFLLSTLEDYVMNIETKPTGKLSHTSKGQPYGTTPRQLNTQEKLNSPRQLNTQEKLNSYIGDDECFELIATYTCGYSLYLDTE